MRFKSSSGGGVVVLKNCFQSESRTLKHKKLNFSALFKNNRAS